MPVLVVIGLLAPVTVANASVTTPSVPSVPTVSTVAAAPTPAPTFRTTAARIPVDSVMGVVNGVKQRGSVRPLADVRAETLQVSVDKPSVEDYWYWAQGVTVTVQGAQPNSKLIIKDIGPDGVVVTTFDPVIADSKGAATATLKGDLVGTGFPTVGLHRLTVNSSAGQQGSVALSVVPLKGRTLKVTTSVSRLTQKQWYSTPISILGTGFKPNAPLVFTLYDPVNGGSQVGRGLRADAKGEFRYILQAGTTFASAGIWQLGLTSTDGTGTAGRAVFTITPSPAPVLGTIATAAPKVTLAAFGTTGLGYTVSGLGPWAVVNMSLRSGQGVDFNLGFVRANGEGRVIDRITSSGPVGAGTYRLTARVVNTGTQARGSFVVTRNDGSVAPDPALLLAKTRLTRLQVMDPTVGITASSTGLPADASAYIEVRDSLNRLQPLTSTSVAVAPTDAEGRVSFTVFPRNVPAPGLYTVSIFTYLNPRTITRGDLAITP